ncbi:unnamed protein product, partial [Acidithrix sp. C25]
VGLKTKNYDDSEIPRSKSPWTTRKFRSKKHPEVKLVPRGPSRDNCVTRSKAQIRAKNGNPELP